MSPLPAVAARPLEDPNDQPLARIRELRDEIGSRVTALIRANGWETRLE